MRNWSLNAALILGMGTLMGCGAAAPPLPELAPVTGTVMMGGKPLAEAVVTFQPEKGGLSNASTDANGHFELKYLGTTPGAVIGKHTVKVSKMSGEAGDELVPRKFNESSRLTQDVKAGPNDIKLEL